MDYVRISWHLFQEERLELEWRNCVAMILVKLLHEKLRSKISFRSTAPPLTTPHPQEPKHTHFKNTDCPTVAYTSGTNRLASDIHIARQVEAEGHPLHERAQLAREASWGVAQVLVLLLMSELNALCATGKNKKGRRSHDIVHRMRVVEHLLFLLHEVISFGLFTVRVDQILHDIQHFVDRQSLIAVVVI